MIIISENICVTPERGRGLFEIMFIWWEGLIIKRNKRMGLLENTFRRGKDLVVISRNIWAELERCRGLGVIILYSGRVIS